MKVSSFAAAFAIVLGFAAQPGCNCGPNTSNNNNGRRDMARASLDGPMTLSDSGMAVNLDAVNACGDFDPSCTVSSVGPSGNPSVPFPLPSDSPPPDNVTADGVGRDPMGYLVLDSSNVNFDFLWIANETDYGIGTVSKISTKPRTVPANAVNKRYYEVARYLTVTCQSDASSANWPTTAERAAIVMGTTQSGACTGMAQGCCDARPAGRKGAIQLIRNYPSRTAIDFNGDVWVGNRAHGAAPNQSSVSKIANRNDMNPAMSDCRDRNGNGKIDTSRDLDGNGIISTDCNKNDIPDDLADVAAKPCVGYANGGADMQEFYGLDDECVLFTTNTGASGGTGRPLTLGPGSNGDFGPADAWAGRFSDGVFYRINGVSGDIVTTVNLPTLKDPRDATGATDAGAPRPYGAVVDRFGILWAPNIWGHWLYYFDTTDPNNPAKQGVIAPPTTLGYNGDGFYGVSVDGYEEVPAGGGAKQLVQQIWMAQWQGAAGGFRYRPKRVPNNFAELKNGSWAYVTFPITASGRGVAVDNRAGGPFAWFGFDSTPGGMGRVKIDVPSMKVDQTTADVFKNDNNSLNPEHAGNGTIGVGVANDLDLWTVNHNDSSLTHFAVTPAGVATAADKVTLVDNPRLAAGIQPQPYTYSDFTGFGLRNFTNPRGNYTWIEKGCMDGAAGKTKWLKIVWDADVPAQTSISVRARAADDQASLNTATWTAPYTVSPADLKAAPALMPNPSGFLQVEFNLQTNQRDTTPRLRGYQILWECEGIVG